jgi:predicted nucleotidyltransferase
VSLLQDYAEFIRSLNERRVRYLVIGGYAVAFHGHPRATDDVDVLVDRSEANLRRVERALEDFVGSRPPPDILRSPKGVVRIGGDVTHVDVTTKIDGLAAFEPLWARRERGELLGEPVCYLSLRDLLRTKRAANRAKDQGDIAILQELQKAAQRRR